MNTGETNPGIHALWDQQREEKIRKRLSEHLDRALRAGVEWVGLFLQGSQNYGLNDEYSDVDTKVIVLPSFDDFVLNRKPISTTLVMDNSEHVDLKDIRLIFECIKKQNVNFVEILFTPYRILNPVYEGLFRPVLNAREDIARYNNYSAVNCMMGMALEKQKAMEHPYPSIKDKIDRYKYDPKQLHHALRMREFMTRYIEGIPYEKCLVSAQHDLLMDVKHGCCTLEQAREIMKSTIGSMTITRQQYMDTHPPVVNKYAEEVLQTATVEILKRSFLREIGG